MTSKMRKKVRQTLKENWKGKKDLKDSEIDYIENKIYEMCEKICEDEEDFEDWYSKIAFEKVGQFIQHPGMKRKIIKDIENLVDDDWQSVVFEAYQKLEKRDNSHQIIGIKVEKGNFQCKNKDCRKKPNEGWNCIFVSAQTRSADEGMSSFVLCNDCNGIYQL